MSRAGFGRGRGVGELAAVGEAVGRHIDDAHHLRLVEADRPLAELQRRARRSQRLPLRGHVIVEAVFDALDRHQLCRRAAVPSTAISSTAANQFSPPARRATLPSWPNGESTKPVGRRSVRHPPRYSAARCCCRKASSGFSASAVSTCQKVQPLQDGAPCSAAPTLWIEPACTSQPIEPSARTLARPAALGIGQHRARRHHPAFDQHAERDARRSRLSATVFIALSSSGRVEAIRSRATFR